MISQKRSLSLSKRLQYSVGKGKGLKSYLMLGIVVSFALVGAYKGFASSQNATPAVLGASTQTVSSSHLVRRGETIFSIAKEKDIDWKILAEINNLRAPYLLTPNQEILVEKPK